MSAHDSIQFMALDKDWLKPTPRGLETEDYTLVFESGDQPSDSVIRLHRNELPNYFKYAISMKLKPAGYFPIEVARALKVTLDQRTAEFANITASVCWDSHDVPAKELATRGPREQFLVARLTAIPCVSSSGELAKVSVTETHFEIPLSPTTFPVPSEGER